MRVFTMAAIFRKFVIQADPQLLKQIRVIASREGKQLQSIIDEAFRDLIDKRNRSESLLNSSTALTESLVEFDSLYRNLAK